MLYTKSSRIDYNFTTFNDGYTQQCQQDGYQVLQAGKVLGGTSSVNAMTYDRGNKRDYQNWVNAVNDESWSMRNTLQYFKKTEKLEDCEILDSPYRKFHGVNGPLVVVKENCKELDEFLEAFKETGSNIVLDLNSNVNLGYSKTQYTIGERRQSTAYAFLQASDKTPYLSLLKNTEVTQIIFDKYKNAIGVKATTKNKKTITFRARKEVILSAGVINSPKLLMLSGVGRKQQLASKNIHVISDLPVGENYQDHIGVVVIHKFGKPCGPTPPIDTRKFPLPSITGHVALNKTNQYPDYVVSSFVLSSEDVSEQSLQYNAFYNGFSYSLTDDIYQLTKGEKIFSSLVKNTIPYSRGRVLLRSTNPCDQPIIETGFYCNEIDLENHVDYLLDYIKVQNTKVFQDLGVEFVDPMKEKCSMYVYGSREYWKCYILCMMTGSGHSVGTCAMGTVVDNRLRVFGVNNLRVVDSSAIPVITTGDTTAATMMLAEKAAEMIIEDMYSCIE